MNPLQAIAFTLRSYIQSRRLQREQGESEMLVNNRTLSEDERYADEIGDLIANELANVRIDTMRRALVYKKGKRLSLHDTLGRLQHLHSEIDKHVLESELLFWIEQTSEPEGDGLGFTQEQMDEHHQMLEHWFDDYEREAHSKSEITENY